jgi:hypothetical protein
MKITFKIYCKNVKLSVCLIKDHAMEKYGGLEVKFHTLLTAALDGGYLNFTIRSLYFTNKDFPVPLVQEAVCGSQSQGESGGEEKNSCPYRESNPRYSSP